MYGVLREYIDEVISGAMRGGLRLSSPNPLRYGSNTTGHVGGNILDDEKEELEEAAVTLDQTSGLALMVNVKRDTQEYVLYDSNTFSDWATSGTKRNFPLEGIRGYIVTLQHFGDYNDAAEVTSSAALKGYGPMLYDIAMSNAPNGIFPDRAGTSPRAKKVWEKYLTRNDVISKPLKTTDLIGDDVLDRSYKIKSLVNASSLAKAHIENVEKFKGQKSKSEIEKSIDTAANMFFSKMFMEG